MIEVNFDCLLLCHSRMKICVFSFLLIATVIQVCDGLVTHLSVTRTENYFTSANYPSYYDRNSDESWSLLTTNASDIINLVVVDSDIEYSGSCVYDYVQVYDGISISSPLLRQFCGTTEPSLKSTGTSLYVHFHADSSVQRRGFTIRYWSSPKSSSRENPSQMSLVIAVSSISCSIVLISMIVLIYYCSTKKTRARTSPVTPTNVQPVNHRRNARGGRGRERNIFYYYNTPRPPTAGHVNQTYYNNPGEALPDYRSLYPVSPPPPYSEYEFRAAP